MDTMSVNEIIKDKFTKLDQNLVPVGYHGDVRSVRVLQERLSKIINHLGEQSSTTQGLTKVVTSAEKLRLANSQVVYLLKDAQAKGGLGEVIGFLKVGRKHLFLYDAHGRVLEAEPLCVLDFYVVGDRQRHGHGKALFDYMLLDQGLQPYQVPIDGPSPKMEEFLRKNYGIQQLQRQSNNFAVCPRFFDNVVEISTPDSSAGPALVGRFAAPPPASHIANVIHGDRNARGHEMSNGGSRATTPAMQPASPVVVPEPGAVPESEPEPAPASPARETFVSPARPMSLRVEPQLAAGAVRAAGAPSGALSGAPSPAGAGLARRDSQLTDLGYFDVKFYHNKLW